MSDPNAEAIRQAEHDGLHDYPVEFLQHLIDSGDGWKYEGALSNAVVAALADGRCVLGPVAHRDYHGNVVPARSQVEPGQKGSLDYANRLRAQRGHRRLEERPDGTVVEADPQAGSSAGDPDASAGGAR